MAENNPLPELKFTYDLEEPIKDKIAKIATKVYGAANVAYSTDALHALQQIETHDELAAVSDLHGKDPIFH